MGWKKVVLAGMTASVLLCLNAGAQVPARRQPEGVVGTGSSRQEPCWEVAGIPKSAMQQRHLIMREAHQQVEAVCANASLSPTQKREEIHQIHERERQQLESLITPSQQETLRACQKERDHIPHPEQHAGGPCAELATPQHPPSTEGQQNEKPPTEENQPH
jgi:hypothetical protein